MKTFFGKPSGVVLLSALLLTMAGMVAIVPASAYVPTVSHLVAYLDGGGAVTPVDSTHPLPVTGAGGGGIAATVTQGTAAAAASSWPVLVTDGTNTLGVTAHPVKTDPTGTTTQPVSGTVTANAGSGTFAASLASLPALVTGSATIGAVNLAQYTPASGRLPVDGSGVTQPVSIAGTVAVAETRVGSSFTTGSTSVGTSAVQITASSTILSGGVSIKASDGNSGIVYVGPASSVTAGTVGATDGYQLSAGDTLTLPVDNLNKVWLIASGASQKIYWMVQ